MKKFVKTRKIGVILLLMSSLCFAVSTVFVKLTTIHSEVPGIEITFFRFFLGFILVLCYSIAKKQSLRPNRIRYVVLRSILNFVAVCFFFTGIQFTTVTNANMLNMTYPVFVYLFTPFINKERGPRIYILYLVFTMVGIYLIINPEISGINKGDIFALTSGIIAGAAISHLREARKYDSSFIVLFYLMAIGSVANFFLMLPFLLCHRALQCSISFYRLFLE